MAYSLCVCVTVYLPEWLKCCVTTMCHYHLVSVLLLDLVIFCLQNWKDKHFPVCTSFQKSWLTTSVSEMILSLGTWFLTRFIEWLWSISSSKFIVSPLTSLKMWCPPKSLGHKPLKTKLWEHGPHVLQWSHVYMESWILYTWHQSLNSLFQNTCMEWFLSLLFKAYKWKWKPLWEEAIFICMQMGS